jgi:branched-chain amino acid transport system permease protein
LRRAYVETPAILIVLIVGTTLVLSSISEIMEGRAINMLITAILVVGLYVFSGNSGVFSFGHAGFMAIGAYTAAAVRIPADTKQILFPRLPDLELSATQATLLGGAIAALVAVVVAMPLMRLSGLAASLGTFAFLNIVYAIASNWSSVSGGSTGLANVPQTTTKTVALIWASAMILLAWLFQWTRSCLRLRATREDEIAAASLGVAMAFHRTVAFALSAFVMGVGGALFAGYYGTFNPDSFFVAVTFTLVAMLVVGGRLSLSGAVVGAIFITIVTELLRRIEEGLTLGPLSIPARPGLQDVGIAVAMVGVLLLRPSGITGGRELSLRPRGRRSVRRSDLQHSRENAGVGETS